MQPTTNHVALILPQYQPHLPGEMPQAYLYRIGSPSAADYEHQQDMHDALVVDQMGCVIRRETAEKRYSRARRARVANVSIGLTDEQIDAVVFYRYDDDAAEVLAVFDPATWEDCSDVVDLESIEENLPQIDREAERADDVGDYRLNRMRDEQD